MAGNVGRSQLLCEAVVGPGEEEAREKSQGFVIECYVERGHCDRGWRNSTLRWGVAHPALEEPDLFIYFIIQRYNRN